MSLAFTIIAIFIFLLAGFGVVDAEDIEPARLVAFGLASFSAAHLVFPEWGRRAPRG